MKILGTVLLAIGLGHGILLVTGFGFDPQIPHDSMIQMTMVDGILFAAAGAGLLLLDRLSRWNKKNGHAIPQEVQEEVDSQARALLAAGERLRAWQLFKDRLQLTDDEAEARVLALEATPGNRGN